MLVYELGESFAPVNFERRNLEVLLTDTALLRKILGPQDVKLIVAHLEASGAKTDSERIKAAAECFGVAEDFHSFPNLGFLFRTIGEYCHIPVRGGSSFRADMYNTEGRVSIVQASSSDYFDEGRGRLREDSPLSEKLAFFNSSHALARRRLYERIKEELGIGFEVGERDGILTAQQKIPQFGHPAYVIRKLEGNSTTAKVQVQRYDSQLTEVMNAFTKH